MLSVKKGGAKYPSEGWYDWLIWIDISGKRLRRLAHHSMILVH